MFNHTKSTIMVPLIITILLRWYHRKRKTAKISSQQQDLQYPLVKPLIAFASNISSSENSLPCLLIRYYQQSSPRAKCLLGFLVLSVPVITMILFVRQDLGKIFNFLLWGYGWFTWTFVEYMLHRFWMHSRKVDSSIASTHHHHHTHPTEIAVTSLHRRILLLLLLPVTLTAFHFENYFSFFAGVFAGIGGYFWIHRLLHHRLARLILKKQLRYHIYHHCKYPKACYGISVPWWDDLFGTVPPNPKIAQHTIDFYFTGHKHSL